MLSALPARSCTWYALSFCRRLSDDTLTWRTGHIRYTCLDRLQGQPVRPRPRLDSLLDLPRCLEHSPARLRARHHPYGQSRGSVLSSSFAFLASQLTFFSGMALAPWNVLAAGKIRTDEEEEQRRKTGEKGTSATSLQVPSVVIDPFCCVQAVTTDSAGKGPKTSARCARLSKRLRSRLGRRAFKLVSHETRLNAHASQCR